MFGGLGFGLGLGLRLGLGLELELIILGTLSLYYYAHSIRGHSSVTQRRWGWGVSDFLEKALRRCIVYCY